MRRGCLGDHRDCQSERMKSWTTRGRSKIQQLHGTVFLHRKTVFSGLKCHAHMRLQACCRYEMTMLSLCLLAFTVAIATLVTPVVVQIMWNKIEGRTVAKGNEPKITVQIRPPPSSVADPGRVRIGGESPSFGPVDAPIRSSTR